MNQLENDSRFAAEVDRLYAGLALCADADAGLGGKLLWAGELDARGRALAVGANIAGAATLAATADAVAQRQANREGVVDFLVTSLDEALRILKNEIRKRETVAVCVALAPEAVAGEMVERGVLPDLLRDDFSGLEAAAFLAQGARKVGAVEPLAGEAVLAWCVASEPTMWLPKLDALAMECLSPDEWASRRWLRLAPRYMGRLAQGVRVLRCQSGPAAKFAARMRERVESGEIAVAVELQPLAPPAASIRLQSSFTP
jgi:urocanate hydratase